MAKTNRCGRFLLLCHRWSYSLTLIFSMLFCRLRSAVRYGWRINLTTRAERKKEKWEIENEWTLNQGYGLEKEAEEITPRFEYWERYFFQHPAWRSCIVDIGESETPRTIFEQSKLQKQRSFFSSYAQLSERPLMHAIQNESNHRWKPYWSFVQSVWQRRPDKAAAFAHSVPLISADKSLILICRGKKPRGESRGNLMIIALFPPPSLSSSPIQIKDEIAMLRSWVTLCAPCTYVLATSIPLHSIQLFFSSPAGRGQRKFSQSVWGTFKNSRGAF